MIRVEHLHYTIGEKQILKDINLQFEKNKIYGMIGPNGAGKSTLLKHIMRIIEPAKQTIFFEGQDVIKIRTKDYAKKCSFVFQENARDVDFTVEEMIAMGRYPYLDLLGSQNTEDQNIVEQIIEELSLCPFKGRSIMSLSGGEAQKVFIGRALAQKTPLLLLDEPISMLDVHNSIELLSRLQAIKEKYGLTVIMVLHDLNLAFQYCDHIVLLEKGEVILAGEKEKVLKSEKLQDVYKHKLKIIEDFPHTYIVPKID
ncbi:MAG: ABC transporter ATP-binding protein [Zhenhengia sp.]|uniref:ABC transporter ATP-binding protein n=1 Tax=Zhenhengia sp. TaxID=2944208 RepID=UPI003991539B